MAGMSEGMWPLTTLVKFRPTTLLVQCIITVNVKSRLHSPIFLRLLLTQLVRYFRQEGQLQKNSTPTDFALIFAFGFIDQFCSDFAQIFSAGRSETGELYCFLSSAVVPGPW